MIFDNICEVKDNYDHRLMELLVKHAPDFTVPLDEDAEKCILCTDAERMECIWQS